jgi:hypothetical protein
MKTFTCVALVLALVLAACGGEDGSADGAAVSIDEALAADADEPLLVTATCLRRAAPSASAPRSPSRSHLSAAAPRSSWTGSSSRG